MLHVNVKINFFDNISTKTKEYLKVGIIVLVLILLIFTFNLPKTNFLITLGVVTPFVIFLREVFPNKDKDPTRKRGYITSILFFSVFASLSFIFDLPKKLYLFFGILAVSSIILYELFNLINDKENKT